MKLVHLSSLEKYLKPSKKTNIILSWNLNNDYFKNYQKKEIFDITKFWQKNKFKIKDDVLKTRNKFFPKLKTQLNLMHKINYSQKEWEIILEPWFNFYLSSMNFRWRIINELIYKYKNFHHLEIKTKKNIPVFDTLHYLKLITYSDIFNHLLLQDILRFKKKN